MDLRDATIFITGGAGLIGSATVDLLLAEHAPARIVIYDNLVRGSRANVARALTDPRVHLVEGDVCDATALSQAMRGSDAVLHLAALRITACAADPRRALEVMCDGSFNVVEAALQARARRLVAASSASVYGLAERFPTTEDHHPYNDRTWYGACKTMLEGLLRSHATAHRLPWIALRYFNVYGPRMDLHGKYTEVLIRWIDRIAAGQPPLILGDGKQTMDFIYVDDVARATVLALCSDARDEVCNVASGVETSLEALAAHLLAVMDSELRPEYGPERSVNPVARRLGDTRKAERVLGFRAGIGLAEGLRRLVAWHQQSTSAAIAA
jgi:UDP-glucose 4-epimerase